ncbi:MAG: CopD family protein, partial [Burkholderiales bacterium]
MVIATSRRWLRAAVAIAITLALVGVLVLWRPSGLYPWLKALHVIAVIAWMAGMLYLPRLFVYH